MIWKDFTILEKCIPDISSVITFDMYEISLLLSLVKINF